MTGSSDHNQASSPSFIGVMQRKIGNGSRGRATAGDKNPDSVPDSVIEFFKALLYAGLIALGIRTVLYEPFNIPSESMLPTLMIGDYLFVAKYPYGYSRHSILLSPPLFDGRILASPVKRGDVAVFKTPYDNRTDFIKRVVGLPGDKIQMVDGQLHINDTPVPRERVDDFVVRQRPNQCRADDYARFGVDIDGVRHCAYPRYRETLPNGRSYLTLDLDPNGRNDNSRVFRVPPGHYFVMGDNRDNSLDSRVSVAGFRGIGRGVGYLPAENLVGRAEFLFFSTDGRARWWEVWAWFTALRWDRLFTGL